MRFRYLIAVPFESHGSDITSLSSDEGPAGLVSASVVPAATVGALDFQLLEPAFTEAPVLVGLPRAAFRFDATKNVIEYSGVPTPRTCWTRLLDDQQLCDRWLTQRRTAVDTLRSLLPRLGDAIKCGQQAAVLRMVRVVAAYIAATGASILLTSLFDEYAFEDAEEILRKAPDAEARADLTRRVLTSSHSLTYLTVPTKLLQLKRIRTPLHEAFLLPPSDTVPEHDTFREFEWLAGEDLRRLRLVRMVYDASEELSVLWISVVSLLSVGLTSLFSQELLSAVQRGERTLDRELREG
ncbi:hypothetical protein ACIRU2_21035 [Streptomyces sp. NPDC101169]|uniref:hypothetical protein n=1 Tax=Streptomyces sp. NPDC101169 TaxID=3366121 RepID=UPI003822F4AF